jgi:iron complex transport system ATP-binding protein
MGTDADLTAETAIEVPAVRLSGACVLRGSGSQGQARWILQSTDWIVQRGEHWVILGPNGSGKTTLLQLAGALWHPTDGTAEVLGSRLGGVDVRTLRERIGHVDARTTRALRSHWPARQIVLGGAFSTISLQQRRITDEHEARATRLLELVGAGELARRTFEECSQGERQRVLLARALMAEPELLILDEPLVGLDLPSRERFLAALSEMQRSDGTLTTLTVTHQLEEISPTTTHALLLRDGAVLAQGTIEQTLTHGTLSALFDLELQVQKRDGRWSAVLH